MLQRTETANTYWIGRHAEQHRRLSANKRNWWPPLDLSVRWAADFERAVEQRGDQAREVFKRYEGWKHARHD